MQQCCSGMSKISLRLNHLTIIKNKPWDVVNFKLYIVLSQILVKRYTSTSRDHNAATDTVDKQWTSAYTTR